MCLAFYIHFKNKLKNSLVALAYPIRSRKECYSTPPDSIGESFYFQLTSSSKDEHKKVVLSFMRVELLRSEPLLGLVPPF